MKFLLMSLMPEIRKMFAWYREPVFKADIEHLKTIHPGLQTVEDYFRQVKNEM